LSTWPDSSSLFGISNSSAFAANWRIVVPTMRTNSDTPTGGNYPTWFKFRSPVGFAAAISAAARLNHLTAADFVRQALLREARKSGVKLRRDGTVVVEEGQA
jgi:hypothetical protein